MTYLKSDRYKVHAKFKSQTLKGFLFTLVSHFYTLCVKVTYKNQHNTPGCYTTVTEVTLLRRSKSRYKESIKLYLKEIWHLAVD
jgi:hypothetical protein